MRKLKRFAFDLAGYGLIVLGIAFGWLPGPGGLPLIVAGLGLLSVHNDWAKRLRIWLQDHAGSLTRVLFPKNKLVQLAYDIVTAVLLIIVTVLAWQHAAIWQISVATSLFFIAITIAGLNRGRIVRLKRKL